MIELPSALFVTRVQTRRVFLLACLALIFLVSLQTIISPLILITVIIGGVFLFVTFARPLWTLAFLSVYLPFEPFLLKFAPDEVYVFARYFSEGLVYVLVGVVLWHLLSGKRSVKHSPLDLPFALFVLALVASSIVNAIEPSVAILGIRQIVRFILVFFTVWYLAPPTHYIKRLTVVLIGIAVALSVLGIVQAFVGTPLDTLLLPTESRVFGEVQLTSGTVQFWDPGSRVFATLGRYDRLGSFLYVFLLIALAWLYEKRLKADRRLMQVVLLLGIPTLILTFSRSSWFAFALGALFISVWLYRDKRVITGCAIFGTILAAYLAVSGLRVDILAEAPGQTLVERFYETFSYTRWLGEYEGIGRTFWFVHTPLDVIPAAPVFGHGPAQFGGGAAAALHQTKAYSQVGLPFGVYGTEGYVDNNWFSIWGEAGTLGLSFFIWLYVSVFLVAHQLYKKSAQLFPRVLAVSLMAMLLAVAFNALLSTLFEIRTTAFYLWLYAGFVAVLWDRLSPKERL